MRSRTKKKEDAKVVELLHSILECLIRIERVITLKHTSESLHAKIFDSDKSLDNEAAIT